MRKLFDPRSNFNRIGAIFFQNSLQFQIGALIIVHMIIENLLLRRRAEHYRDVLLPLRAKVTEQTQLAYNAMQVGPQVLFAARREEGEAALGYLEALRAAHAAQVELELAVGSTLEEPRQKAAEPPAHHHHGGAP